MAVHSAELQSLHSPLHGRVRPGYPERAWSFRICDPGWPPQGRPRLNCKQVRSSRRHAFSHSGLLRLQLLLSPPPLRPRAPPWRPPRSPYQADDAVPDGIEHKPEQHADRHNPQRKNPALHTLRCRRSIFSRSHPNPGAHLLLSEHALGDAQCNERYDDKRKHKPQQDPKNLRDDPEDDAGQNPNEPEERCEHVVHPSRAFHCGGANFALPLNGTGGVL